MPVKNHFHWGLILGKIIFGLGRLILIVGTLGLGGFGNLIFGSFTLIRRSKRLVLKIVLKIHLTPSPILIKIARIIKRGIRTRSIIVMGLSFF